MAPKCFAMDSLPVVFFNFFFKLFIFHFSKYKNNIHNQNNKVQAFVKKENIHIKKFHNSVYCYTFQFSWGILFVEIKAFIVLKSEYMANSIILYTVLQDSGTPWHEERHVRSYLNKTYKIN